MAEFRLPIHVCVFLFRRQGVARQYLLLHRVAEKGAFWKGVTGSIEEGETLFHAASRRTMRRRGLLGRDPAGRFHVPLPAIDKWWEAYGPDPEEIVERAFVAEVDGGEPTLSREHDAWGWHLPEEAATMLKWPNNIEALRRCEAFSRRIR